MSEEAYVSTKAIYPGVVGGVVGTCTCCARREWCWCGDVGESDAAI